MDKRSTIEMKSPDPRIYLKEEDQDDQEKESEDPFDNELLDELEAIRRNKGEKVASEKAPLVTLFFLSKKYMNDIYLIFHLK